METSRLRGSGLGGRSEPSMLLTKGTRWVGRLSPGTQKPAFPHTSAHWAPQGITAPSLLVGLSRRSPHCVSRLSLSDSVHMASISGSIRPLWGVQVAQASPKHIVTEGRRVTQPRKRCKCLSLLLHVRGSLQTWTLRTAGLYWARLHESRGLSMPYRWPPAQATTARSPEAQVELQGF